MHILQSHAKCSNNKTTCTVHTICVFPLKYFALRAVRNLVYVTDLQYYQNRGSFNFARKELQSACMCHDITCQNIQNLICMAAIIQSSN